VELADSREYRLDNDKIRWSAIGKVVHKSPLDCKRVYLKHKRLTTTRQLWQREELLMLRKFVRERQGQFGIWEGIGRILGRMGDTCRHKYSRLTPDMLRDLDGELDRFDTTTDEQQLQQFHQ
jgi:hypothetical protein